MNLPNKLTLLRVALIPVFVALMMIDNRVCQLLSTAVFALASLTDLVDGYYARKHDMVTDFGKLMDPMADKLLVMAALIGLTAQGRMPWLCAMVLLAREFIVSSIRLVAASKGVVVAADALGKYKTATQMIALILILLSGAFGDNTVYRFIGQAVRIARMSSKAEVVRVVLIVAGEWLIWISVALSVVSCASYIRKNWGVFTK